jgi:leucyl-tRNA synthetase
MDEKYFAKKVEAKWQKKWAESGAFEAKIDAEKPKFYQLEMLPYPSGNLHMGHVRNYSVGDAVAWFKRLKGFNVLAPDSVGFVRPARGRRGDQARRKSARVDRREYRRDAGPTAANGFQLRLARQMAAHRPDYYKFDQWFFSEDVRDGPGVQEKDPGQLVRT